MFTARWLTHVPVFIGLGLLPLGCGSPRTDSLLMTEEQLREESDKKRAIEEHLKEPRAKHVQAAPSGTPAQALRLRPQSSRGR